MLSCLLMLGVLILVRLGSTQLGALITVLVMARVVVIVGLFSSPVILKLTMMMRVWFLRLAMRRPFGPRLWRSMFPRRVRRMVV